jgi:hypothetical protein
MSLTLLGRVDERFLNHRMRSTSLAGNVGAVLATLLFSYRAWFHVYRWDLLTVALTIVGVKLGAMVWFGLKD